ncbi:MAG: cysteine-rich CWC family protein [Zhongshania sp.]|uniref:cysteine-rich CWC family protein n=1 Tax=Zhongshania sp. TaxID=1971902 RepID=UPI0026328163|nr:cysteine-rich CWC family protein [Zhongshania sp.]MDF1693055.1 cysteine-rich CWC family protein [Zhongshania sp.]
MLSSQAPLTGPNTSAAQCPLCGQDNQCAVAAGSEPSNCWCMAATLDTAAKQQAASMAGPQRCICAACGRPSIS